MKYVTEIEINLPRDQMVALLDDPENMKHWQKGLISYRLLSGEAGKDGAQMELEYQMGKRHLVMVETILKRAFPTEFHATYDTKGMHNIQENYFEAVGMDQTKWTSKSEFIASSFMLRMMMFLMPGAFKKQSKIYMEDFKNFAEKGTSVAS